MDMQKEHEQVLSDLTDYRRELAKKNEKVQEVGCACNVPPASAHFIVPCTYVVLQYMCIHTSYVYTYVRR